jgi:hypothetical protein
LIIINYDFISGNEVSYIEGKKLKDDFETNVLDFFNFDIKPNVVVLKKDGSYINKEELLKNNGSYTKKEIRKSHNIIKLLKSGYLDFKIDKYNENEEISSVFEK